MVLRMGQILEAMTKREDCPPQFLACKDPILSGVNIMTTGHSRVRTCRSASTSACTMGVVFAYRPEKTAVQDCRHRKRKRDDSGVMANQNQLGVTHLPAGYYAETPNVQERTKRKRLKAGACHAPVGSPCVSCGLHVV